MKDCIFGCHTWGEALGVTARCIHGDRPKDTSFIPRTAWAKADVPKPRPLLPDAHGRYYRLTPTQLEVLRQVILDAERRIELPEDYAAEAIHELREIFKQD